MVTVEVVVAVPEVAVVVVVMVGISADDVRERVEKGREGSRADAVPHVLRRATRLYY